MGIKVNALTYSYSHIVQIVFLIFSMDTASQNLKITQNFKLVNIK